MSSYFTNTFVLLFLPASILLYSVMPKRFRWVALLVASYLFAWTISKSLIAFMMLSTVSIYGAGLAMGHLLEKRDEMLADAAEGKKEIKKRCKRNMRIVLVAGIVLNFGILIVLKYLGFFGATASSLLTLLGIKAEFVAPRIGIPIGISFYTLMAVSYLIDVYRESVKADRHLGRVALFLCFFPQIMEGPICRYSQTASALTAGEPITRSRLYSGLLRILIGFAKKMIIADRLNLFVEPLFENYAAFDGGMVALGAVLYTVQLYCDFSGTMDVALGVGQIFGVSLPENFRQPFFSRSASEFWQRWHITLGTWFKDYVYYPVSLSKPMKGLTAKARKRFGNRYGPLFTSAVALFCVWLGNGLWHGAGSQYVFFGMYYFVLILTGGFIEPAMQKFASEHNINRKSAGYHAFQIGRTLIVIFVGELFFRAASFADGTAMFGMMLSDFSLASFADGTLLMEDLTVNDYLIVLVGVVAVIAYDTANERGFNVIEKTCEQGAIVRWAICLLLVMAVVVFGAYGYGYSPVDPMYAQF